jgi:Tfp pilus assembly PilM family ATPase
MSAALPRWFSNRPPAAAVEINPRRVTAAVIADQGRTRVLTSYAGEPLAPGVVEAALNAANVHDAAALTAAIRTVLDRLSSRPKRIALVLPDTVGKLSLVRFEKIPAKLQDLDQLIRWQVRKTAPFRIEDAQVSWVPGIIPPEGGREYIVTVARRDIIQSYERACEAAGTYAGIVDLATVNLINAVMGTEAQVAPAADWLLVHVAADYSTMAVIRASSVIFFRTRTSDKDDDLADLVHQTAMYHEDRLEGKKFSRVWLCGGGVGRDADQVRAEINARLGVPVEAVDVRAAADLGGRVTASTDVLEALAAPLGVLLRDRKAA